MKCRPGKPRERGEYGTIVVPEYQEATRKETKKRPGFRASPTHPCDGLPISIAEAD